LLSLQAPDVFSSRDMPKFIESGIEKNFFILRLKSPDILSVLKKRVELLTNGKKREKAKQIISFVNCCSQFPCLAWQPLAGMGGRNKSQRPAD